MPYISIVTTLYKSEEFIEEFYQRSKSAVQNITNDYEMIFVDDGSPDKSIEIVKKIINEDKKIRLIELSRNFGHHKAILTGLEYASGEFIFLNDCDLEVKPEYLLDFYTVMQDGLNNDVVYGYMQKRGGSLFKRLPERFFYKFFNHIANVNISENILLARLMKKEYKKNLLMFKESHIFLLGLLELTGYKQIGIPIIKTSKGSTTYSLMKKLALASDGVFSFSIKPVIYISLTGMLISFISFCFIIHLIFNKFIYQEILSGWTSVMVSLWFIGGLIITSIGIIGIYIGKIFIQAKNRPNAIIKRIYP